MANLYIKLHNMPPKLPIMAAFCWMLILERFNAPGWAFGVMYSLIGFVAIHEVYRMIAHRGVDIVGNDPKL